MVFTTHQDYQRLPQESATKLWESQQVKNWRRLMQLVGELLQLGVPPWCILDQAYECAGRAMLRAALNRAGEGVLWAAVLVQCNVDGGGW